MATVALQIALNVRSNDVVQSRRRSSFSTAPSRISTFSSNCKKTPLLSSPSLTNNEPTHTNGLHPLRISGTSWVSRTESESHTFDVVIVGAGIIGLTIARQILLGSNLSVAVVDAAVPCAGATGAGQGYIWRIHKDPRSDKWDLAIRSHQLWEAMAERIEKQGMDPLLSLGWKKTGSMLVGRTAEDCSMLRRKVEQLADAGLGAKFLSHDDLLSEEPNLNLGVDVGAAFMPDDCQLDARRAVAFIEEANRHFKAEGRYAEFYYEPVTGLLRNESNGEIEAIQTSKNTLRSTKAVVVATGSWTGSVMHDLLKSSDIELDIPVKPRKGHLLVLENFNALKLNHGLMEVGYVNHESAILKSATSNTETRNDANTASVSMTATMDMSGRLVLGSSRQLVGFSTEIDESIIDRIWARAGEFFPILRGVSLGDVSKNREVRVGLRPYMPGGKPVIGPVPGLSKMFVAAGHEGEGLSLALGTAEMVYNMILENPPKVDTAPFSL